MVGQAIKFLRKQKGLTLVELGNQAGGVTHATISRYERGDRQPSEEMLRKIAHALGVSRDELSAIERQLSGEPESPVAAASGQVTSDADLALWHRQVTDAEIGDPNVKFIMYVLERYLDPDSWVISTTLGELAKRASLPLKMVESIWPSVIESPFIDRIGSGEWTLRLVMQEKQP